MKNNTQKPFPWALSIFPLLHMALFSASVALADISWGLALLCFLVAAILLSFSIHIFFHECVHHAGRYSQPLNFIASLFIGLPFDGYRLHHYNHHFHENGPGDFSTTWLYTDGQRLPRNIWSYTFGWYRQVVLSLNCQQPFPADNHIIRDIKQRMRAQKYCLLIVMSGLLLSNGLLLLAYLAFIFAGWFFTALHNYGQHPPCADNQIRTFANTLYNRCFFNNGLHWEHHKNPALSWYELQPSDHSRRIHTLHLLNPLIENRS